MNQPAARVKSPWHTEPKIAGEDVGVRTDRLAKFGATLGINRQCSIGWHSECSDPEGESCRCICHGDEAKAKQLAFDAHWAAQPAHTIPAADQVETFSAYDFHQGWDAATDYHETACTDMQGDLPTELDRLTVELTESRALVAHLKGQGREHGGWDEMRRQREEAKAGLAAANATIAKYADALHDPAALIAAYDAAGDMPHGTMTNDQWRAFAGLYNVVMRIVDAIESHEIAPAADLAARGAVTPDALEAAQLGAAAMATLAQLGTWAAASESPEAEQVSDIIASGPSLSARGTPAAPDPIEVLRALAEYRAEYSGPECALQASTLRHAADIIDGTGEAWGLLPSWRWDEFSARFPTLSVVPVEDDSEPTT